MDDQFGGRTDDDLFYDDFEPVESEAVVVEEAPKPAPEPVPSVPSNDTRSEQAHIPPSAATSSGHEPQGLASSRYADKPPPEPKTTSEPPSDANKPPPNAPTAPKEKPQRQPGQNPHVSNAARLQSGANPRQKLTEDELAAKMEKMKLLAAEKTRKFEKAEEDERQHAEAYERGMEEARKRRLEAEQRRKRGEENQRKLNDEREKNRERKLKAMGMKEGGWDEGKEAMEEEEARRGFKGANGGIRGSRRGGLGGSRYARDGEDQPDVDRFLDDRYRGRGRGRGRGTAGRGGRGGADGPPARAPEPKQSVPKTEDFPALPSDGTKKAEPAAMPPPAPEPTLPLPPGAKWDDEMEALDDLKKKGQ